MTQYAFVDPDTGETKISDQHPDMLLCDFCLKKEVHRLYPTKTHEFPSIYGAISTEGWAACKSCSELIDGKKWDDLHSVALEMFLKKHPELKGDRAGVSSLLREIHKSFRDNRIMTH
jgi:hypothetical protein